MCYTNDSFFGKCRQYVLAKVSQLVSQSVFPFGDLAPRSTTAYNIAYIRQIGDALKVNQFALFHPNRVVYMRGRLAVGRENRVVSSKLGSLY